MKKVLNDLYPNRIQYPSTVKDIKRHIYYVYILTLDNKAIVVGHGKINRAQIIFDNLSQITSNHIKSLNVRLYNLFYEEERFDRYIIESINKEEAKSIEATLHKKIGGNTKKLPKEVLDNLFNNFSEQSLETMALKMALLSSFDGISDIKKWRRENILVDSVWNNINNILKLPYNK